MKITRRFALATLLVIAVAVVLGAPAPASADQRSSFLTYAKLYPAADSLFPHSTGTLTLRPVSPGWFYDWVSVSVSRLAPNARYYMPMTVRNTWSGTDEVYNVPIQTDAHGKGGSGWGRYNSGYLIWRL